MSLLILGIFLFIVFAAFIINAVIAMRAHNSQGLSVTIGTHNYRAEVADTAALKMKGLSGRERLAPGTGMLFQFTTPGLYPFWMKGMKISIDFIWIRGGRVVAVDTNAPPDPALIPKIYKPIDLVDTVFEVPAGTVQADGIEVGDGVVIELLR